MASRRRPTLEDVDTSAPRAPRLSPSRNYNRFNVVRQARYRPDRELLDMRALSSTLESGFRAMKVYQSSSAEDQNRAQRAAQYMGDIRPLGQQLMSDDEPVTATDEPLAAVPVSRGPGGRIDFEDEGAPRVTPPGALPIREETQLSEEPDPLQTRMREAMDKGVSPLANVYLVAAESAEAGYQVLLETSRQMDSAVPMLQEWVIDPKDPDISHAAHDPDNVLRVLYQSAVKKYPSLHPNSGTRASAIFLDGFGKKAQAIKEQVARGLALSRLEKTQQHFRQAFSAGIQQALTVEDPALNELSTEEQRQARMELASSWLEQMVEARTRVGSFPSLRGTPSVRENVIEAHKTALMDVLLETRDRPFERRERLRDLVEILGRQKVGAVVAENDPDWRDQVEKQVYAHIEETNRLGSGSSGISFGMKSEFAKAAHEELANLRNALTDDDPRNDLAFLQGFKRAVSKRLEAHLTAMEISGPELQMLMAQGDRWAEGHLQAWDQSEIAESARLKRKLGQIAQVDPDGAEAMRISAVSDLNLTLDDANDLAGEIEKSKQASPWVGTGSEFSVMKNTLAGHVSALKDEGLSPARYLELQESQADFDREYQAGLSAVIAKAYADGENVDAAVQAYHAGEGREKRLARQQVIDGVRGEVSEAIKTYTDLGNKMWKPTQQEFDDLAAVIGRPAALKIQGRVMEKVQVNQLKSRHGSQISTGILKVKRSIRDLAIELSDGDEEKERVMYQTLDEEFAPVINERIQDRLKLMLEERPEDASATLKSWFEEVQPEVMDDLRRRAEELDLKRDRAQELVRTRKAEKSLTEISPEDRDYVEKAAEHVLRGYIDLDKLLKPLRQQYAELLKTRAEWAPDETTFYAPAGPGGRPSSGRKPRQQAENAWDQKVGEFIEKYEFAPDTQAQLTYALKGLPIAKAMSDDVDTDLVNPYATRFFDNHEALREFVETPGPVQEGKKPLSEAEDFFKKYGIESDSERRSWIEHQQTLVQRYLGKQQ